jgi:hypothetical protein
LRDEPSLPILTHSMSPADSQPGTRTAARKRWLYALWYAEACLAVAAVWAELSDRAPHTLLEVVAFLLLCGAALTMPARTLRALLMRGRVRGGLRLRGLELFLVLAAAGTAAALSTAHGWAAVVCILLVGNALWALELEWRAAHRGRGVSP